MGTLIQRFKLVITALVIIAFNFSNLYAQCSLVTGLDDVDVLADLNCMGVASWTEPTYSLVCEDFDDGFDHTLWSPMGPGSILITNPTTLVFQGGTATAGTTTYCVGIPCGGTIAFSWSARMWNGTTTGGTFLSDEVGFSIDGSPVELANAGTSDSGAESGLIIPAGGGDFCFFANSDGIQFWSELTITDFVFMPGIERQPGIVNGSTVLAGCYTIEYAVCDCNFAQEICSFEVCINDETGPTAVCPMDITVNCLDIIPAAATTVIEFEAIDGQSAVSDCSGLNSMITSSDAPDPSTMDVCVGGNMLRTYFFEDTEGNPRQCGQWINVEPDVIAPVITTPGNIGWGQDHHCGIGSDPHSLETAHAEGFPTVMDNCNATDVMPADFEAAITAPWDGTAMTVNNVTLSYTDVVTANGNLCNTANQRKYSITRTWTVLDQCGNMDMVDQNINVGDNNIRPTAVPVMGAVALQLDAACAVVLDVSMIEGGSFDNCGSTDPIDPTPFDVPGSAMIRIAGSGDPFATSITIDPSDFNFLTVCPATISIQLRVEDFCGNRGFALKDVTVEDVIDPVIDTCPPTETFEGCSEADIMAPHLPYSATAAPATFADFADVGGVYTDACGLLSITYIDVLSTAGCPSNPHTMITRTWTLTDGCTGTATCDQILNFEDTMGPMFVGGPTNVSLDQGLQCGEDYDPHELHARFAEGFPTISDVCGVGTITPMMFNDNIPDGPWDGTAITIPTLANLMLAYSDDVIPHPAITIGDPCPTADNGKLRVHRTWTITDACGNVLTSDPVPTGGGFVFQRINLGDVTDPVITTCPGVYEAQVCSLSDITTGGQPAYSTASTLSDEATFNSVGGAASDNCAIEAVSYQDINLISAPMLIIFDREWTISDGCNMDATCIQSFRLTVNDPPVITCPMDFTVELSSTTEYMADPNACASEITFTTPAYTDDCDGIAVMDFSGDFNVANWAESGDVPVDVSGAPANIVLTGSNSSTTNTDFCINVSANGFINFDWSATMDLPGGQMLFDEPQFVINGTAQNLPDMVVGVNSDMGTKMIAVLAGDQICFRVVSNNLGAYTILDISNFSVSSTMIEQTAGPASPYMASVAGMCTSTETIEHTVTDGAGKVTVCSYSITLRDNVAPVLVSVGIDCSSLDMLMQDACMDGIPAPLEADVAGLYMDACNTPVTATAGTPVPTGDNCGWMIVYPFEISDACGNTTTCQVTHSGADATAPTYVDPPGNIARTRGHSCGMDIDPHALHTAYGEGFPEVGDNCLMANVTAANFAAGIMAPWDGTAQTVMGITLSFVDIVLPHPTGICSRPEQLKYRIERTWTIMDACGNSVSSDPAPGGAAFDFQRINVVDGPTNPTAVPTMASVELTVDASCETTLDATVIEGASFDNCGIDDPLDPSTFDVGAMAMIRRAGTLDAFAPSLTLTTADFDFSVNCPFTISIELMVEDECGNTGTALKDITVEDGTAPVIGTCPPTATFEGCDETAIMAPHLPYSATEAPATPVEFAAVGGVATDNCGIATITYIDVFVGTGCPNPNGSVTRTWTVTDFCSNPITCDQLLQFEDTTAPAFVDPPENIDRTQGLTCQMDVDPHTLETAFGEGFPEVSDNCLTANVTAANFAAGITAPWDGTVQTVMGISISYVDNVIVHPGGACSEAEQRKYRIERTWTIMDACGNQVSSDPAPGGTGFDFQRINVVDGPTDPTAVAVMTAIDLILDASCEVDLAAIAVNAMSFDNCGVNDLLDPSAFNVNDMPLIRVQGSGDVFAASITIDEDDFDLSISCPATVTIELQVTDECGNTGTALKDITIADTTNPTITTCPTDDTIEGCDESAITDPHQPYSATTAMATEAQFMAVGGAASDFCGIATYEYIDVLNFTMCPNPRAEVTRTWTVTDDCLNTFECVQTLMIEDTTEPGFLAPPENIDRTQGLTCGNDVDPHSLEDDFSEGFPTVVEACIPMSVTPADFYAALPNPWDGTATLVNGITISYVDNIVAHPDGVCTETEQRKYRIHRTWTAVDPCGNVMMTDPVIGGTGFDFQRINVVDGPTNPTAITVATAIDLILDANCEVDLAASAVNGMSFDNCGVNDPLDPSTFDVNDMPLIRVLGSGDAFASEITIDEDDFALAIPCPVTVTIELQVTDECGNTGTETKDITVTDNTNPTLSCPPSMTFDLGPVTCDTMIIYPAPVPDDNCGIPVVVLLSGIPSGGVFPIGTTTQEFEATDQCGNTARCQFDITINEYVPDGLVCKNINVSLNEDCEAEVRPDMVADLIGCVDNYSVTLIDAHGNPVPNPVDDSFVGKKLWYTLTRINTGPNLGIECTGEVLIELKQKPELECPPIIVSACSSLDLVPKPTATGNCSTYTIKLINEEVKTMDCDRTYVAEIVRTYIAIDASGTESDPCMQSIFLERINLKSFRCPRDTVIECTSGFLTTAKGYPDPSVTGYPTESGNIVLPGTSEKYCNSYVDFEDQLLFDSGCKVRIMRFWSIREWWCTGEETFRCPQIIEILDTLGPVLTCPADFTISTNDDFICGANVDIPAINAVDGCSKEDLIYKIDYATGFLDNVNGGTDYFDTGDHDILYTVYDKCGNSSSCTLTVTVEDNRQPVAICDFNSIVSLSGSGIAVLNAEIFDDGSWDDCGILRYDVARMGTVCDSSDLEFGPAVKFCCADVGMENMVAFRVTDYSGNMNTCMVGVRVQDKIKPVLNCLDNAIVDCRENLDLENLDLRFGFPTATDSCSTEAIIETFKADINQCGKGTIERLFTLTDNNGEVQTCTQIITLTDNTPFTVNDINWPDDLSTSMICDEDDLDPEDLLEDFPESAFPIYIDDECNLIGENHFDEVFDFSNGSTACFKIIRTWKVINWCDTLPNGRFVTFEWQQELKVTNTSAPVITGSCDPLVQCSFNIDCLPDFIELKNTADDDCTDSMDLVWSYVIDGTVPGSGNDASGVYDLGEHIIVWTVRDRCGNSSSCEQMFEVRNCKSPIPICKQGLSSGLEAMDTNGDGMLDAEMTFLKAKFFDGGTYHNCGNPIVFSFSADTTLVEIPFDCDDIGIQPIKMWVTDVLTGAQDFCETFVDIQDNNDDEICPPGTGNNGARVAGQIFTEDRENVEDVQVDLEGSNSVPEMTDFQGRYTFPNMPFGGDYSIAPEKDVEFLNGVSTLDLVLIQRHILGLSILDSPYKLIAADANNDNSVSALDLIDIRKLILGIYDKYPTNDSWRFVDEGFNFADPDQPWLSAFAENYNIQGLSNNMDIDFIAMKIGDVNATAIVNLTQENVENRNSEQLQMNIESIALKAGQKELIKVFAPDFDGTTGFQFAIDYDKTKLNILAMASTQIILDDQNYSIDILDDGVLAVSWHKHAGNDLKMQDDEALFEIYIEAKEDLSSNEIFRLSNSELIAEAYKGNSIYGVALRTLEGTDLSAKEAILYQNTPNPWVDHTEIRFFLPVSGEASLRVYNSTGELLKKLDQHFQTGVNTISLDKNGFPQGGMYTYELIYKNQMISKRMIILN